MALAAEPSILELDAELYAKLSLLQSQVLSATHPTFKLVDAVVQKLRNAAALVSQPPVATSVIPALPEKSNELVHAEFAQKRQRLEQILRDTLQEDRSVQQQQPKRSNKERDEEFFAGPNNFDITDLIERVEGKERVIEAEKAAAAAAATSATAIAATVDSPNAPHNDDDDSYYSSKAPASWSGQSEEGELDPGQDIGHPSSQPNGAHQGEFTRDESYSPPPPDVDVPLGMQPSSHQNNSHTQFPYHARERESESYSPPSPDIPLVRSENPVPTGPRSQRNPAFSRAPVPNGPSSDPKKFQKKGKQDPPGPKFLNKRERKERDQLPQQQQSGQHQNHGTAPTQPMQPIQNGKRRRRDEDTDDSGGGGRRRSGRLAAPNMGRRSPPPHALSETEEGGGGRLVVREDGRMELVGGEQGKTHRTASGALDLVPTGRIHGRDDALVPVPYGARPPIHEGELRRLTSAQYAPPAAEVRYIRTASGEFVPEPQYTPRLALAPPPPAYDPYGYGGDVEIIDRRTMPPPPQRRIVVLEDGGEYELVPSQDRLRQSMPPEMLAPALPPPPPPPQWRYADEPHAYVERQSLQPVHQEAPRYVEMAADRRYGQYDGAYDVNQAAFFAPREPSYLDRGQPIERERGAPMGQYGQPPPQQQHHAAGGLPPPPPPPPPPHYAAQGYGAPRYM